MVVCKTKQIFSGTVLVLTVFRNSCQAWFFQHCICQHGYSWNSCCLISYILWALIPLFFLFSPLPPRLAGQKSVIKEPLLEALSSVTTCFTAVYHCRLCSSLKAGSYVFTSTSTGEALGSSLSAQQLQTYQPPKSLKIEGRNFNKGITGSIFSNKSNIPFS